MRALLVLAVGCTTHKPAAAPEPVFPACADIAIVDEAGGPLAGARVEVERRTRSCGPSMLPEACMHGTQAAPPLTTNASGIAQSCGPASIDDATIVVTYRDWPRARAAPARTITIGPPRTAFVEVPGCPDARVTAQGPSEVVHGAAVGDGRFALAGLGPWTYTVRNTSESGTCATFARIVDVRHMPAVIALVASDTVLAFPELAGATVTLRELRSDVAVATATLDTHGDAMLALPASTAHTYCARVETADRCIVTFVRAGERAAPLMWLGREREVEAQCGRCRATP